MDNVSHYIGCAAIIIRSEDNKVFIGQRKLTKSFGGGLWETVGGSIDKDDKDFLACITREIREELNVDIEKAEEFKDYTITTKAGKTFLVKMFIVELAAEPIPASRDFEQCGWFDKDEIEQLEFISNCKERLENYFSLMQG